MAASPDAGRQVCNDCRCAARAGWLAGWLVGRPDGGSVSQRAGVVVDGARAQRERERSGLQAGVPHDALAELIRAPH